jgi:hypothetical protein
MSTHLVIPDVQAKPGAPIHHLEWVGKYIQYKQPDVIIQLGDFADMESLSSYDKGKKSHEGRRYKKDTDHAKRAMDLLVSQFSKGKYSPRMILTLGNHEERIDRAVEVNAELEGTMSTSDLGYESFGFEVHDFLEVVKVDGVAYSHFFPRSAYGRVSQTKNGAPNARAQLIREGSSCTSGHCQGLDVACMPLGGRLQWGIIAGSCYLHKERYLSPQGNVHWNGVILKHDVHRGEYSPILVTLDYLKSRFS